MDQKDLDTWEDFESELMGLRKNRAEMIDSGFSSVSTFRYRGQRDHSWPLVTTLEQQIPRPQSLEQYFHLISVAQPEIETFTGRRWDLPEFVAMRDWAKEYDHVKMEQFKGYDFMVYLRHHRFPSPLLDWTRSPYVAAYFAFFEARSDRVAIYAYLELAGHGKSGQSDLPQIISFGPYVTSHSRHFLQQSEYTACCLFKDGKWWYAPHEDGFSASPSTQDRLWKFTLPASERLKALRILDDHNLNAFSLFQDDESLLKTIMLREIEFREMDY